MPPAVLEHDPFAALAEPRRRRILEFLGGGEHAVNDLVASIGPDQPSVSKALRVLRDAGLVRVRQAGRRRLYSVNHQRIKAVNDWTRIFEQYWSNQLDRIKAAAERAARSGDTLTN